MATALYLYYNKVFTDKEGDTPAMHLGIPFYYGAILLFCSLCLFFFLVGLVLFYHINKASYVAVIQSFAFDDLLIIEQVNGWGAVHIILVVVIACMIGVPGIGPFLHIVFLNEVVDGGIIRFGSYGEYSDPLSLQ